MQKKTLFSVGMIGLLCACAGFDPKNNVLAEKYLEYFSYEEFSSAIQDYDSFQESNAITYRFQLLSPLDSRYCLKGVGLPNEPKVSHYHPISCEAWIDYGDEHSAFLEYGSIDYGHSFLPPVLASEDSEIVEWTFYTTDNLVAAKLFVGSKSNEYLVTALLNLVFSSLE